MAICVGVVGGVHRASPEEKQEHLAWIRERVHGLRDDEVVRWAKVTSELVNADPSEIRSREDALNWFAAWHWSGQRALQCLFEAISPSHDMQRNAA